MILEANNITVSFGKNTVLHDVSHTFKEGKITVILGPNGCGKTTLVKAVVKLHARSGELAYIAQDMYGNIGLTVRDMVALGRYDRTKFLIGESPEDQEHIDRALTLMKLKDKEERIFDTLSGGEKQRCMAARAICQDGSWFIMDEPSSNLDAVHSKLIMDTARELTDKNGKSFIIVMHDVNTAVSYADEFVLMKDGRIIRVCETLTADDLSLTFDTSFRSVTTPSGKSVFYTE
ncbi:MAG: ABC transporter ATP-binding protein [Clostridiales bacterium]|nr:ABC transporter ATP-binding protein [Clostridiales bacterium]